jgi:hypothetical protein
MSVESLPASPGPGLVHVVIESPRGATARIEYRGLDDLPGRVRDELDRFFLNVTAFEGKNATVLGHRGAEEAFALVTAVARPDRGPQRGGR